MMRIINFNSVLVLLIIVVLPRIVLSVEVERDILEMGDTVSETDVFIVDEDIPGFPCMSGYELVVKHLCISTRLQGPSTYMNAEYVCRRQGGRVANYEDFLFICKEEPSLMARKFDVYDKWLGHITGDDLALYGNTHTPSPVGDCPNFEGETSRFDRRNYWCAYTLTR